MSQRRARPCNLQEDDTHPFDGDVARAKSELFRSRRFIATAQRELEAHEQWLHRHDVLWQEDLKQCQRRIERKRAYSARKDLAFSLMLFMARTCRALLYKAVQLLKLCGRWALIVASWLAGRARVLAPRLASVIKSCIALIGIQAQLLYQSAIESAARRRPPPPNTLPVSRALRRRLRTSGQLRNRSLEPDEFSNRGRIRSTTSRVRSQSVVAERKTRRSVNRHAFLDWRRHAAFGSGLATAAVMLLAAGVVKSVGSGDVTVTVVPDNRGPVHLAALAPREPLLGRAQTRELPSGAAPGVKLITSEDRAAPVPLSGKDVASMILLTSPVTLEPNNAAPGVTVVTSVAMPKPPRLSGRDIASMMLLTTPVALASLDAEAMKRRPAARGSPAGKPQPKPSAPLASAPANAEMTRHALSPATTSLAEKTEAKRAAPMALAPVNAEALQPAPPPPSASLAEKMETKQAAPMALAPANAEVMQPAQPPPSAALAGKTATKRAAPLALAPANAEAMQPAPLPPPASFAEKPEAKQAAPVALAPANAGATKPVPADSRSLAGKPKPQRQPKLAAQRHPAELHWRRLELRPRPATSKARGSSFVPYSSW